MLNLYRAEMENRQDEIKAQALGFIVALNHMLDVTLNKGKGEILKNWLELADAPKKSGEIGTKPPRSKLSPDAVAFFSGLPAKTKKG